MISFFVKPFLLYTSPDDYNCTPKVENVGVPETFGGYRSSGVLRLTIFSSEQQPSDVVLRAGGVGYLLQVPTQGAESIRNLFQTAWLPDPPDHRFLLGAQHDVQTPSE